jgi:hypothetical protein
MREFIIYCDESDKEGKYFANFYGGALVRSVDWDNLAAELRAVKERLNLKNELKW